MTVQPVTDLGVHTGACVPGCSSSVCKQQLVCAKNTDTPQAMSSADQEEQESADWVEDDLDPADEAASVQEESEGEGQSLCSGSSTAREALRLSPGAVAQRIAATPSSMSQLVSLQTLAALTVRTASKTRLEKMQLRTETFSMLALTLRPFCRCSPAAECRHQPTADRRFALICMLLAGHGATAYVCSHAAV